MVKPLNWGIAKETYPDYCAFITQHEYHKGAVTIKQDNNKWAVPLMVTVMPGDCGTLLLNNASSANDEGLKKVANVASINGFDTIFATLIDHDELIPKFEAAGWKVSFKGFSNRKNKSYTKTGLVLHLTDCVFKGYSG